jgi:magnesium transporter
MSVDVPAVPRDLLRPNAAVRACVAYGSSGQRLGDITLDAISDVLQQPETFVWLGLHEPDAALLEKLQEEFGLHDLAVEDAHHAHQRPKIEAYGESLFVVLKTLQEVDRQVAFGETHVFLGKRYILTVRHGASLSYGHARDRCEREPELLALGPSYCLYAVLDLVVDRFAPVVASFREDLEELEEAIFAPQFRRKTIQRLYDLKKDLVSLRLAIAPLQDILNQLARQYPTLIHEDVRPYLRDVHDHVVRVQNSSDTMSEMLSAAMSVNLAMVSVGQNESVRRLAGWAAIVAIPTLIASIYGMNFVHMPELAWPIGYPLVIGAMIGSSAWLYWRLKKANWL